MKIANINLALVVTLSLGSTQALAKTVIACATFDSNLQVEVDVGSTNPHSDIEVNINGEKYKASGWVDEKGQANLTFHRGSLIVKDLGYEFLKGYLNFMSENFEVTCNNWQVPNR